MNTKSILLFQLSYKLRTDDSYRLPSTTERDNDGTQCRTTSENSHTLNGEVYRCGPTNYFFSGFMTLQSAIDFSWIKVILCILFTINLPSLNFFLFFSGNLKTSVCLKRSHCSLYPKSLKFQDPCML